jgi:hypothetical protein
MLSWAQHLRLFRTPTGYLGFGTECVQEGDVVFIVPSSRVPLVFRNSTLGRWRLVGGVYVHGVMHGEILCPSCGGKDAATMEAILETLVIE